MIINSTLDHVFKNIRYKLLRVDDKYYLYDADRVMWSILFPFIYWFIPHPVYQIDEVTYENLKVPNKEKRSKTWLVAMTLGVSVPLGRMLSSITEQYLEAMPYVFMVVMFIVFIAISLIFRLFLHRSRKRKMNHTIELDSLSKKVIKMRPAKRRGYIQALIFYLYFLGISVLAGFGYVEIKDFLLGVCFAAFVYVFLLTNTVAIPIGSVHVTYLENDD